MALYFSHAFFIDVNRQDNSGKTPLHTAILSSQYSIVNKLLESGADVTITDDAGDSVIHTAIRVGSERLVQVGRPSNSTLHLPLQSWSRIVHLNRRFNADNTFVPWGIVKSAYKLSDHAAIAPLGNATNK